MSTEEYYAAVNRRLHEIRESRKQDNTYSRAVSEDYFAYLNEKSRNKNKIN